jgi:hypothetical protein
MYISISALYLASVLTGHGRHELDYIFVRMQLLDLLNSSSNYDFLCSVLTCHCRNELDYIFVCM